jgi:hypothetical protein
MEPREPTVDETAGINGWNSMTEAERTQSLENTGWKSGGTYTPSAADAWAEHKKRMGQGAPTPATGGGNRGAPPRSSASRYDARTSAGAR